MTTISQQSIFRRKADGSIVAPVDQHQEIKVYQTKEYSRFSLSAQNRAINQTHLLRLEESIREHGYLKERPIDVIPESGNKLLIVDGQHRFSVCRKLDLPIFYVVKGDSPDEAAKSIRVINAFTRAWKDEDFLRHFIALDVPDYKRLRDMMGLHDLTLSTAINLFARVGSIGALTGRASTDLRQAFRTGSLKLSDKAIELANGIMAPVNAIRNLHERLYLIRRDPAFIKALIVLTSAKLYEHDRFLKNLATNIAMCVHCTSITRYFEVLEHIYNYKRKDGSRLHLSRKGLARVAADTGENDAS